MNDSIFKRKNILKAQYIYNIFLLLILLFGVSYALVTFIHNEEGLAGNIVSSLVKITVDEETSFNLDNTSPVTDEVGLTGYSKILTLTNTSSIDSLVTVTLNPDIDNDIETSSIKYGLYINGTLKKTAILTDTTIYNGLLLQGEKIQLEVYLWVDSTYTGTGTIFKGTFEVKGIEAVMTMADYVTKLVDKDKGVYKVGNDYRYSGTNPDNYIWFNCKDGTTGGSNNCELWQIVGSLETKANEYANTYRRVKIVKVDNLDNQIFGTQTSFAISLLNTYLNDTYYTSLTGQSQKMVIGSSWNVGSSVLTNTPEVSLTSEQATKLYTKVGLLSASDFGYSTSLDNQTKSLNNTDLYNNSWLKGTSYYTLTPISENITEVIGNNATSLTNVDITTSTGVKPVVSLIPNVYIKGGNGTEKMPYEIAPISEEEHYSDVKIVGYVTYDVNGQTVTTPKMQAIFADGSTVINGELPNTSEVKFKGWSTSKDGEVVYQKGDTITATSDVTLYAVWRGPEKLVDKITSTLTLTDASTDIDGTRYVTGDKDTPNYLWYSGKLWRIVSINGDGSIKLVTQGNMTSVAWDTSSTNTNYGTSQVRKWLNNEFLPTLANIDTLLVDSIWDYTTYASETATKVEPTAIAEKEKVGLLTIYDYYKVRNNANYNFLGNDYTWWTMSPKTDNSKVWYVYSYNGASYVDSVGPNGSYGIRPSVNFKIDTLIMDGEGTKLKPYTIVGDKDTGVTSELLYNRISGEYIKFNDVLYRIVGTEEFEGQRLTKITMADYNLNKNTLTTSLAFNSNSSKFSTTYGIGLYLEEWYEADETSETYATTYIKENYKAMIATSGANGVVWYTGPSSGTIYDYTLSKTENSVSATIGLGYYGEMFSSQFGDGYGSSNKIWLMTNYKRQYIWHIYDTSQASNNSSSAKYGVRPSMYLKSNIKIVSGSGMPHDPYEIEIATPVAYITYDTNGVDVTVPKNTPIYSGGNTIINATLEDTSKYNFLGWSTSSNGEVMYQKGDTIDVTNDIILYAIWEEKPAVSLIEKITSTVTLTDANSDGTRFATGTDVNNYVSYSGLLWRAVGVNSDGTVKLITQDSVASLSWDSAGGLDYSTSSIRTYLNNDFLSTLNTDLIVDSTWDYSMTDSSKPDGTLTVTEKVGLLSYYEYYSVSNGNTSNYLVNGSEWWTLTVTGTSNMSSPYVIAGSGSIYYDEPASFPTFSNGVRPSVVLKANIEVVADGLGTADQPYVLVD